MDLVNIAPSHSEPKRNPECSAKSALLVIPR